jgi:hypothetical protein
MEEPGTDPERCLLGELGKDPEKCLQWPQERKGIGTGKVSVIGPRKELGKVSIAEIPRN